MATSSLTTSDIPTTVRDVRLVQKRREQIIRAGIKLFAQKGFHKTSLKELAVEAGLSQGNIYSYVHTKEDIFFLIYEFVAKITDSSLSECVKGISDPLEKLRRMVRSEFNFMNEMESAILLLYQEMHILRKPYLKKLLEKESERISRFENVLQECVDSGQMRKLNTLAVSNLLKAMLEAWVAKRWNLRGRLSRLEMEESLLDLLVHGIVSTRHSKLMRQNNHKGLHGKSVLLISGETSFGKSLLPFLLSKGASITKYGERPIPDTEPSLFEAKNLGQIKYFQAKSHGKIKAKTLRQIFHEHGPYDIVIYDLGASHVVSSLTGESENRIGTELERNLLCAQEIAPSLEEEMSKRHSGRIIFVCPWGWERFADPLRYGIVRGGIISLSQALSKRLGSDRITVNCVVPGLIDDYRPLPIEKEKLSELINLVPFGHFGEISDVLEAIYFFLSDASKYVTGQVLEVGGGVN
ncbi:MAG: SDR family oxidoreductase [Desulfobacteraceae bacterium]|nr:SDR family oxidoreductase [Desulfobacteraceae bacterium]